MKREGNVSELQKTTPEKVERKNKIKFVDQVPATYNDACHAHSTSNAHGGQTELLSLALQLGEDGGDLTSTGASQS